jgi:plastocyanin
MVSPSTDQILRYTVAANKPDDHHVFGGASTTFTPPACALGRRALAAYLARVRTTRVLAALSTGLLLFSGCAGDASADQIDVTTKEMRFSPSTLRVDEGRHTFTVRNSGNLTHTFSLNALGREVTVRPDKTRTMSIDLEPGTYRYVCRILDHEGLGMHGVLRVSAK